MTNQKNINEIIPQQIIKLLNMIPEGGAACVNADAWETVSGKTKKCIAKNNGRVEFFEYTTAADWETVYMWNYAEKPEDWEEHFDLETLPNIAETLEDVF